MIDPHIGEAPMRVTDRTLRQFSGLCLLFFGGLGCWQQFDRDNTVLALAFAGLALVLGLPGLVLPQFVHPLFMGAMVVSKPIGLMVSWLLLALLFYGMFTPLGLFFRLIGRDALCRRYRPDLDTYWTPKAGARDVRSYFRQS
jgi:hypothetical protein